MKALHLSNKSKKAGEKKARYKEGGGGCRIER